MPELLLEILSEEIPARMQVRAAADLKRLVGEGLKEAGLSFDHANAYVTPRRLVLVVDGLPLAQPDVKEERKGPRIDAPKAAIDGFLKSTGLRLDQCEKRETPKGAFWFAVVEKKGEPTHTVFLDILRPIIWSFPWPKSMRWEDSRASWVRPLQSILILFNGKAVEGNIGFEGAVNVSTGGITRGHRFHAPQAFEVKDFADYKSKLAHNKVILDGAERRLVIEEQAIRLAALKGLKLKPDHELLSEVAGLVEWPVALMGAIDEAFMALPPEVLRAAMRSHQKYFSLLNADGSLAPYFIIVANLEATDGGKAIVAGNERVLRARLSDAKFFWDQDRKIKLEDRLPELSGRVFYKGLGSMADKAKRIASLAREIAAHTGASASLAERGARLAKADLSSGMVGEFPELQGIMGGYYAGADGEGDDVAKAISEHYAPQGPNDACPTHPIAVAVALADKIDTLAGFFGVDEKPTGSKDPFALRRAALGVIRLIIENDLKMPLRPVFKTAMRIYGDGFFKIAPDALVAELLAFFADRLKAHLKEKGVRHDLIAAVFEASPNGEGVEDDLPRLLARVNALKEFLDTDDGANLLVAYRRAANILRIEEKKDGQSYDGVADQNIFKQDDERSLFESLASASNKSRQALKDERFADAMSELAKLRRPVDAFFDNVTVNCEDLAVRTNRLMILSQIRAALGGMADFSKIEGTGK